MLNELTGIPDTAKWCFANPEICGPAAAAVTCALLGDAILTGAPGELTWGDVEKQSSPCSQLPYDPRGKPALPPPPPVDCSLQSSAYCP